jgi:hypothetical protein
MSATLWPIVEPRTMDDDESVAIDGMIGRGDQRTRRKPAPVSLYSPQIRPDLNRGRNRAAAMGSRLLTA